MSVFRRPPDSERNVQATLYIGNLDPQVTEMLVYELLVQFAPVKSLNFPKDRVLKTHQGYGFAEFRTIEDAEYVVEVMKGVRLFGKPLRVNRTEQAGSGNKGNNGSSSGGSVDVGAKLFVKNLSLLVDEQYLQDTFSRFGTIIRPCVVVRDDNGESKGHGFVTFADFEASDAAVEKMNGNVLMNNKVTVEYAFKSDVPGVRHGDEVERRLAAGAKAR